MLYRRECMGRMADCLPLGNRETWNTIYYVPQGKCVIKQVVVVILGLYVPRETYCVIM